jgi:hypothetical protein
VTSTSGKVKLRFFLTGVEGFLLYRAVVTVFDTGETRRAALYLFGYGLPLLIGICDFDMPFFVLKDALFVLFLRRLIDITFR